MCGETTFTTNSAYQRNLHTALSSMSSDTRITYGYYKFSAGQNPDKVEAKALCRVDIPVDNCRSCVSSSVASLPLVCPNVTQAFAFSENCLLYYTDGPAFHVLTDEPYFSLWFNGNVTNIPNFNSSLTGLMTNLTQQASIGNSEIKFATGETRLTANQSLYGLVQCSPDLTRIECVTCVQYIVSNSVPKYLVTLSSNGSIFMAMGGRVLAPSCNFRYELYPFYKNVTYTAQPPAPHRNTTAHAVHRRKKKQRKFSTTSMSHRVIVIVVPIVSSLVLNIIIAALCILLRKKKQRKFSANFNSKLAS